MIPKKLLTFLEKQNIKYTPLAHKTVYTAYDAAATLKVKLSEVAKVVMLSVDPPLPYGTGIAKYMLVVLPSHVKVDFQKLKKLLKVKKVAIAPEAMLTKIAKAKPGLVPPFALFHKVPVMIDKTLTKRNTIITNAGSYTDSLQLKAAELVKAGGRVIASFGKKQ